MQTDYDTTRKVGKIDVAALVSVGDCIGVCLKRDAFGFMSLGVFVEVQFVSENTVTVEIKEVSGDDTDGIIEGPFMELSRKNIHLVDDNSDWCNSVRFEMENS